MLKSPSAWKLILLNFIFVIVLATIVVDFSNPSYPNWSLFQESDLPTNAQENGAKAAILALAGAAALFTGLFPHGNTRRARRTDTWAKIVGALAAGATGWFWLLSATDGRPGPYLIVLVPVIATYSVIILLGVTMSIAAERDRIGLEEAGDKGSIWWVLAASFAFILSCLLVLSIILFVPRLFS